MRSAYQKVLVAIAMLSVAIALMVPTPPKQHYRVVYVLPGFLMSYQAETLEVLVRERQAYLGKDSVLVKNIVFDYIDLIKRVQREDAAREILIEVSADDLRASKFTADGWRQVNIPYVY